MAKAQEEDHWIERTAKKEKSKENNEKILRLASRQNL